MDTNKEKEENVKENGKKGKYSVQVFRKEMRFKLVYVVVVRNQASVNKINNYLITFN